MSYEDEVASLVIAEVYPEDEGPYFCRAENEAGSVETACELIVQGERLKDYINQETKRFFLAPAVTVGETEGAMDSTSVFFWPLLLPITL